MDVKMPFLPSSLGFGGWESWYRGMTGKKELNSVAPRVRLDQNFHLPILDADNSMLSIAGPFPVFCSQIMTSNYNNCKYMRHTPPVTLVNQVNGMTSPQGIRTEAQPPLLKSSDVGHPLWYPASSESQLEYQDLLQSFSFHPSYSVFTDSKIKSSKPLNPEAKEWVPNKYKESNYSNVSKTNPSPVSSADRSYPSRTATVSSDSYKESMHREREVCKSSSNKKTDNPQDNDVDDSSKNSSFNINTSDRVVVDKSHEKISQDDEKHVKNSHGTNIKIADGEKPGEYNTSTSVGKSFSQQVDMNPLSYANITRKSPEPLPPVNRLIMLEGNSNSHGESAKQPLPKIFIKDRKYPKEKAPLSMEKKKKDFLPFKTASRAQKKCSKMFLKDLRETSPAKIDASLSKNAYNIESNSCNSDVMARLCVSTSPLIIDLSKSDIFSEKCAHSSQSVKSQRSVSESSGSSISHTRTQSESTVGSVDSLDIEFGEEIEIQNEPKYFSGCLEIKSNSAAFDKSTNSILSYILGFENSDSEESDEDDSDDSSWDTVGECNGFDDLDSWQTCGLVIPMSSLPSPKCCSDKLSISEEVCDNLDDINKRWSEEICKDICDATPNKVRFGEIRVYPMVTWSFAYRNARQGPWEQYARDRSRFQSRILSLEPVISPVLSESHRMMMYDKLHKM
ncbi:hypothetical protein SK128_027437 [Halocaridina rubra]|uniref:Protein DP71L n=1 Tax=Halocaridina rubra TaxID=373956 RepID=A0AAN8ZXQ3_HALRR